MNKKALKKILTLHKISQEQWDSFNDVQQHTLTAAKVAINVSSEGFIELASISMMPPHTATTMEFRDLSAEEEADFRKWARSNYTPGDAINPLWHPVVQDECAKMNATPEPTIDDLGANTVGKRKSSGPRTGAAMGAKPHVRKLLGTANPDGVFPKMTMDDICNVTKKSQINIRTILSDLRSEKYCGSGGVFKTIAIKIDNKTYYQFSAE